MARVASVDKDNVQVMVTLPAAAARRLGLPDDAQGQPLQLEISGDERWSRTRPKIEDLALGAGGGGNISKGMLVSAGSVIKCDRARVEDGKLTVSWVRLISGAVADDNAERSGARREAALVEGHLRTYPVGKERDRWRTDILDPGSAARADSMDDIRSKLTSLLSDDSGPGAPEATVRISNSEGMTMHRRAACWLKPGEGERERETPEEAVERFLNDKPQGASKSTGEFLEEALAPGDDPAVVEIIPLRSVMAGPEAARDINEKVGASLSRPTLRGSDRYNVTEIHPARRLTGSYDEASGEPGEGLASAVSRTADERGRNIPPAAMRDANAARAFLDQNAKSFGYALGTIAVREGVNRETQEKYEFGIGLVADTMTGLPLAAIATPAAPQVAEYAKERSASLNETRDALLSGAAAAEPYEGLATDAEHVQEQDNSAAGLEF